MIIKAKNKGFVYGDKMYRALLFKKLLLTTISFRKPKFTKVILVSYLCALPNRNYAI